MSRALTERERAAVEVMLSVEFDAVQAYRDQVGSLRVIGSCGCGCLTIDFTRAEKGEGEELLTEAYTDNALVLLFARSGRLSCLEYAPIDEHLPMPAEFPLPPDLRGLTADVD
jgi:hypothetical protein